MEISAAQLNYHQLKFEGNLAETYFRQLSEPAELSLAEAHEVFEARKLDIEVLWATDEGKSALFPQLTGRQNMSDRTLDGRRAEATERLAILFESSNTVESVALRQRVEGTRIREALRMVFRRVAVVQRNMPELLEGTPLQFSRDCAWSRLWTPSETQVIAREPETTSAVPTPAAVIGRGPKEQSAIQLPAAPIMSMEGVKTPELRQHLQSLFEENLTLPEQRALMLLYGLDGRGVRNYHDIGRELGVTQKTARRRVAVALASLRNSDAITSLSDSYRDASRTLSEAS